MNGSWFIQSLCEELLANAHKDDLDTMMTRVLLVTPCLFTEYGKYLRSGSIFHEAGGRMEYPVFRENKQGATILSL